MELPRYFIVGARPVKLVATPEGGMDCLAYDFSTGEMVRNMDYLGRVVLPTDPEVDVVSEEEFEDALEELRSQRSKPRR